MSGVMTKKKSIKNNNYNMLNDRHCASALYAVSPLN